MLSNLNANNAKSLDLNQDKDSLRPVGPEEFLPQIHWWVTIGGLIFVAIFGATLTLVSILKYKVTIKAPATVRPVGELRIVQAATEGPILKLAIRGNQTVKKGDLIATIDDSRLQTKKSQLQNNIQQAQQQLVQINAQITALESQIKAETNRIERTIFSAEAELERQEREYRERQMIAAAEVEEAEANVRVAREDLQKAQAEMKSAQANLRSTRASYSAAQSKYNRYQSVASEGALPLNQLEEAKLDVDQQQQAVVAQQATVVMQKETIERLQGAVLAALARLERTQASLDPSRAEVAIAEANIPREQASGRATLAILDKERKAIIQQRIETQNQLSRDRQELQQIETELKGTVIRASASGIVQELILRNPDQIVRPGDVIAQIAASEAPLEIKALVASQDIDKVEMGQKVQMRVSACPYPNYGTLKGTVKTISPDATTPQGNNPNALSETGSFDGAKAAYNVTIEPESLSLDAAGKKCSIRSGMEGRADIISKEETVLTFILRKARLLADF